MGMRSSRYLNANHGRPNLNEMNGFPLKRTNLSRKYKGDKKKLWIT
jgi:hypothetical protein